MFWFNKWLTNVEIQGFTKTALEASRWLRRQVPSRCSGSSSGVLACEDKILTLEMKNITDGLITHTPKTTCLLLCFFYKVYYRPSNREIYLYQKCNFTNQIVYITENEAGNSSCNSRWPGIDPKLKAQLIALELAYYSTRIATFIWLNLFQIETGFSWAVF